MGEMTITGDPVSSGNPLVQVHEPTVEVLCLVGMLIYVAPV